VDNKEARVGKIPEDTYRVLQGTGMMRVVELFRVQQYSKTYNESGDHRNVFYAESSLLVHYLYDNQQMLKVADYFDAVRNHKESVEEATQKAFGMTPEQLDKALRNYLNSGHFKYYPMATPAGIVAAQFTEAPVSTADARAVLADVDAHSPDHHDRALGEFEDVLKTDPNNASALRGAGYSYLQRQDFEHAGEYFRKAAQQDSKDPRVHYYNAMLMNRSGALTDREKSEEVKKELETALALDPKLADAYSLLAYAQAFSGEPEKGLATMKKAVELSPRNETYQTNLANIYLANHKMDEAIALFQVLASSANPQVSGRATVSLAQAQQFKDQSKSYQLRVENRTSEHALRVRDAVPDSSAKVEAEIEMEKPAAAPAVRFIKGKITGVDCSAAPAAWLTFVSGSRPLKLYVGDSRHVVLFGADSFSCEWKNKNVAVNYRDRQDGGGDVVSLEIQ
jgi:tetratricopeptide (TPR) repeat protein